MRRGAIANQRLDAIFQPHKFLALFSRQIYLFTAETHS